MQNEAANAQNNLQNRKNKILRDCVDELALAYEFVETSKSIVSKIQVDLSDDPGLAVACLFMRADELFQTTIYLLESGHINGARVVLRTLLEITFRIGSLQMDDKGWEEFKTDSLLQQNLTIDKLLSHFPGVVDEQIRDKKNRIASSLIASQKTKPASTFSISNSAGLAEYYHSAYNDLSKTVHSHLTDIGNHIHTDDKGQPVGFASTPDTSVRVMLMHCMDIFMLACNFLVDRLPTRELHILKEIAAKIGIMYQNAESDPVSV